MTEPKLRALICTVGGTADPIVQSIAHWRPARVWFVTSADTRKIANDILLKLHSEGQPLSRGACDVLELSDPQSLGSCIRDLHGRAAELLRWSHDSPDRELVVDITGGTKQMSTALGLVASRWPCRFSYVGGDRRSKNGLGVVELGTETVIESLNPWDELGLQAIEEAAALFDRHAYAAAAAFLKSTKDRMSDPQGKSVLATFADLSEAYEAWERFDHKRSQGQLDRAHARTTDLERLAAEPRRARRLLDTVQRNSEWLGRISGAGQGEDRRLMVLDLLANAKRRAEEGRYDDAVARLYRALEAAAQARLAEVHGVENTGAVPVEKLTQALRRELAQSGEPTVILGLQHAYRLLRERGDELGQRFADAQLDDYERSPLNRRNRSILAHGWDPISKNDHDALRKKVETVLDLSESPPEFPRLRGDG